MCHIMNNNVSRQDFHAIRSTIITPVTIYIMRIKGSRNNERLMNGIIQRCCVANAASNNRIVVDIDTSRGKILYNFNVDYTRH